MVKDCKRDGAPAYPTLRGDPKGTVLAQRGGVRYRQGLFRCEGLLCDRVEGRNVDIGRKGEDSNSDIRKFVVTQRGCVNTKAETGRGKRRQETEYTAE